MSRKPRGNPLFVLIDMDQVLCKFEERVLETYRKRYPDEPFVPLEERQGFWIHEQYTQFAGEEAEGRILSIIQEVGFYRNLEPIEHSIEAAKEIAGLNNTYVYLCSSPLTTSPHSAKEKIEWIQEHLGQDWVSRLILTTDKTMVYGHLLFDDKARIYGANRRPSWEQILYSSWSTRTVDIRNLRCKARLSSWADRETWMKIIEDKRKEIA